MPLRLSWKSWEPTRKAQISEKPWVRFYRMSRIICRFGLESFQGVRRDPLRSPKDGSKPRREVPKTV
eukprot:7668702-Pyramimonas_sp.AAC.1